MDWTKVVSAAILLLLVAATIVGNIYFQRWNRRRGERLASEAAARGETVPTRIGLRIVLIAFSVIIIIIGGILLIRG